jgi:TPR repeat protein
MKQLLFVAIMVAQLHAVPLYLLEDQELRDRAKKEPDALTELALRTMEGKAHPYDATFIYESFSKAAEAGVARAEAGLGLCHKYAVNGPINLEEAVKHFRKATELEDPQGMVELGLCLIRGDGLDRDAKAGMKWIEKAAATGYPDAKLELAHYQFLGYSGSQLSDAGMEQLMEMADQQGSARAAFLVGFYYNGLGGGEKKPALAKQYFQKGADGGDYWAMFQMGNLEMAEAWKPGINHAKSLEAQRRGVAWYRKSMAGGHSGAKVKLAKALSREKSFRKEGENWYAYLVEEADKGQFDALTELGSINNHAPGYTFRDLDWSVSANCYEKLLAMGSRQNKDGSWSISDAGYSALFFLLDIYYQGGLGQERNLKRCMELASRYAPDSGTAAAFCGRILLHPDAPLGNTRKHFIHGYACMTMAKRCEYKISDKTLFIMRSRHSLTSQEIDEAKALAANGFPDGITPILP